MTPAADPSVSFGLLNLKLPGKTLTVILWLERSFGGLAVKQLENLHKPINLDIFVLY